MVNNHLKTETNSLQKIGFLTLSIVAIMMTSQYINLSKQNHRLNTQTPMKLSVMSFAAPRALPTPTYIPQPSEQRKETSIVNAESAKANIADIKPLVKKQATESITISHDFKQVKTIRKKVKKETAVQTKQTIEEPITPKTQAVKEIRQTLDSQKTIASIEKEHKRPDEIKTATTKPVSITDHNTGQQSSTSIIREARFRKQTPPRYPRRAIELGQQGIVTLHAKIMPNGQAKKLKVAESSGHRLLDKAALSAVKKWEFEPTEKNGDAITSWVSVPVRFVIQ